MATDPKAIAVAMAIKQSIETSGNPGLSVNAHPNAFFLNVIGSVDLLKAAEAAIKRAESFEEGVRERFNANVKAFYDKLETEFKAGAVSIEDALARMKAKAGGELIAAEGVIDSAIAYAKAKEKEVAAKVVSDPDGHG